ncbi:MAG TPA: class I SAM-dependent methyltransferase [Candidatus Binataceae bacterium]|jgi:ubiquinone/menaquinone biosynthesis C-methylase UbiE
MAIYDRIGVDYDATRRADPYIVSRLLHHLSSPSGRYCLDLACGTGNYTAALAATGTRLIAIDQSSVMLAAAREKSPTVTWMRANADSLPFAAASFDAAMSTLAHHHFPDIDAAFAEVFRVLKPAGRFVIFTFTPEQMRGYWMNEYFPTICGRAIDQASRLDTPNRLARAGFREIGSEPYDVRPDLQDFFMYSGKHQPARYLDPTIRAGISGFAVNPDDPEIASGCARLADDIKTGRFEAVASRYRSHLGDYVFFAACRP